MQLHNSPNVQKNRKQNRGEKTRKKQTGKATVQNQEKKNQKKHQEKKFNFSFPSFFTSKLHNSAHVGNALFHQRTRSVNVALKGKKKEEKYEKLKNEKKHEFFSVFLQDQSK